MKSIQVKKNEELGQDIYDVTLQDSKEKSETKLTGSLTGLPPGEYDLEPAFDRPYGLHLWTITKGDHKGFKICPIAGYNPEKNLMVSPNPLIIGGKFQVLKSRDGILDVKSFLRGERKAKLVVEGDKAEEKKPATKKKSSSKKSTKKETAKDDKK